MSLQRGQIIDNRYRIVELIGRGGYGAVYRAWDLSLQRACAVKENLDRDEKALQQFEREALFLAELRHPNLPRVIDHFIIVGQGQYLVMNYVDGKSLSTLLAESPGPLPEEDVLSWIDQVCDALNYLHTRQPSIIHRDVKPENIIITSEGRAMLVDFGISKAYVPHSNTTVGARAVTAGFSPPEQYGGNSTDVRTDIYALGATLYALLTGVTPPESVQRQSGQVVLAPPRTYNSQVPAHVQEAVLKAMELSAENRFQSVDEFQAALGIREAVSATTVLQPVRSTSPRQRVMLGIGILIVFGLLMAAAILLDSEDATANSTPVTGEAEVAAAQVPVDDSEETAPLTATPTPSPTLIPSPSATTTPSPTPSPTTTPTPTPLPSPTSSPTLTPACPAVTGVFSAAWAKEEERLGCARGAAFSGLVVEQDFHGGRMVWREPIDFAQALVQYNSGTWQIYQHPPYVEGDPEYPCADANTPAQSPPTPKRGFGAMWCNIGEIRSNLGNAVDVERPFTGSMQYFESGSMLRTNRGTIFIFFDDGTWTRR